MNSPLSNDIIYQDLGQACESLFGLQLQNPTALKLGLMNLKWKVDTNQGTFVLKQFSRERYERYDIDQLAKEQEFALREQVRHHHLGTPCPKLFTHEGNTIHRSRGGERFVVMEFVDGKNVMPGTLNEEQMYALGRETAKMHLIMNDGTHRSVGTPKFIPPSKPERLQQWHSLLEQSQGNERLVPLIEQQIHTLEQFTLELLDACRPGWAHRDLWVDNILFTGNEVAAILDFDRFAFDYPELDIARATMSGALCGQNFNRNAALAFYEGYQLERQTDKGTWVRSLRLLWYLESVWWVAPYADRTRYQEVQFENEMVWLAEHLYDLPALFGDS